MDIERTRQTLEMTASNFAKYNAEQWVEDCVTVWTRHPAVQQAGNDRFDAAMLHCMATMRSAPTLRDVLDALRLPGSAGAVPAAGCGVCRGYGSFAVRLVVERGAAREVRETACRCGCGAGARFSGLPTVEALRGPGRRVEVR